MLHDNTLKKKKNCNVLFDLTKKMRIERGMDLLHNGRHPDRNISFWSNVV